MKSFRQIREQMDLSGTFEKAKLVANYIPSEKFKQIGRVIYMNDGDWVESATALLEHTDGT